MILKNTLYDLEFSKFSFSKFVAVELKNQGVLVDLVNLARYREYGP